MCNGRRWPYCAHESLCWCFGFNRGQFVSSFHYAQRLTNKFLSLSTRVQKWAHHQVINIVGWNACTRKRINDFVFSSSVVAPAEGNNKKFICLSPARQKREEKSNFYFAFLSLWYALKINRDWVHWPRSGGSVVSTSAGLSLAWCNQKLLFSWKWKNLKGPNVHPSVNPVTKEASTVSQGVSLSSNDGVEKCLRNDKFHWNTMRGRRLKMCLVWRLSFITCMNMNYLKAKAR